MFPETEQQRERRRLVDYIASRGGAMTARRLQHGGRRRFRFIFFCELALKELESLGYGRFYPAKTSPRGGRPTRVFQLHAARQAG